MKTTGIAQLRFQATNIAAHGRNGDTTLVHMSPDEVRDLSRVGAVHTNPVTGLPEMFDLGGLFKNILPIVAGIGGTLVAGPLGGALATGATTTATTGNLQKGLMSGLMSFGLGSALQGVGGMGAGATDAAAKGAAGDTIGATMPNVAGSTLTAPASMGVGNLTAQIPGTAGETTLANIGSAAPAATGDALSKAGMPLYNSGDYMSRLGDIRAGLNQPLTDVGAQFTHTIPMMATVGGAMGLSAANASDKAGAAADAYAKKHAPSAQAIRGANPYTPDVTPAYDGYMPGVSAEPNYGFGVYDGRQQNFATGGMLRGPGTGMSDNIPARHTGTGRPINLSSNEYVVPADVVSALGDGSSDAGAQRIQQMIARIRQHTRGSTQQPAPIDPNAVMPA